MAKSNTACTAQSKKLAQARSHEKVLYKSLIGIELELAIEGATKSKNSPKVKSLRKKKRAVRARYIKAAARLDRARAYLGVKARCV